MISSSRSKPYFHSPYDFDTNFTEQPALIFIWRDSFSSPNQVLRWKTNKDFFAPILDSMVTSLSQTAIRESCYNFYPVKGNSDRTGNASIRFWTNIRVRILLTLPLSWNIIINLICLYEERLNTFTNKI